jgi:hypothetical protein
MANKQPAQAPKDSPLKLVASHPAPADVMLTKEELAAKLKVAIRTIENWQRKRYLPFIKVANVVMFYWPTVLTHLQTHFSVSPRGVVSPQNKN